MVGKITARTCLGIYLFLFCLVEMRCGDDGGIEVADVQKDIVSAGMLGWG